MDKFIGLGTPQPRARLYRRRAGTVDNPVEGITDGLLGDDFDRDGELDVVVQLGSDGVGA